MKNRFIFFNIFIYFLMFFSSYSYSSNNYEEMENNASQEIAFEKIICLTLKADNFRNLASEDKLILVYLNKLLDHIVEKNRNLIGNKEFCIFKDGNSNSTEVGFSGAGNGLIEFSVNLALYLQYPSYTDADIVAILSHEIAHDILNHPEQKIKVIGKIYDDYSKMTKKELDGTDFDNFYIKDPRYISTIRQQEIEADNLGFQIYLNSGFKIDNYKKHFIKTVISPLSILSIDTIDFSLQRSTLFKALLSKTEDDTLSLNEKINETISILLHKIKEAKKKSKKDLDQLMSDIKYIDPDKSSHPTGFWRYLNIDELEKRILKNKSKNIRINKDDQDIIDIAYFKIDLNGSSILKKIKRFFSKNNYSSLPINYLNSKDPRVYIVNELISNYSEIEYSLELDTINPVDIGSLKNDNTIILKANTIFSISIMLQLINHIETNHTLCTSIFSEGLSNWMYYQKMLIILKKDLNNSIKHLYI